MKAKKYFEEKRLNRNNEPEGYVTAIESLDDFAKEAIHYYMTDFAEKDEKEKMKKAYHAGLIAGSNINDDQNPDFEKWYKYKFKDENT